MDFETAKQTAIELAKEDGWIVMGMYLNDLMRDNDITAEQNRAIRDYIIDNGLFNGYEVIRR